MRCSRSVSTRTMVLCLAAFTSAASAFVLHPSGQAPQNLQSEAFVGSSTTTTSSSALYSHFMYSDPHDHYGRVMPFQHALAVLAMPYNSQDRIANEAILNRILPTTNKLSVVLRCNPKQDYVAPSLTQLRRYVGEVYSQLWDYHCSSNPDTDQECSLDLNDVVVYPQNMPNVAPCSWIHIAPDLDAVCSHDSIIGWHSEVFDQKSVSRGQRFSSRPGHGRGGLYEHVNNINAERKSRNLPPVHPVHVDGLLWPRGAPGRVDENVIFLDDDDDEQPKPSQQQQNSAPGFQQGLVGGARLPSTKHMFDSVAVGGTFDGLHYGHRKLLTLAVSSVHPNSGRLLVGVTVDSMLRNKDYAEFIPPLQERMDGVKQFLRRLAPGLQNRMRVVPIRDAFGPPGQADQHFDALVLSHETLESGHKLNQYRVENLGLKPLKLLCTRRTEAHGMSSTTLRRMKALAGEHHQEERLVDR